MAADLRRREVVAKLLAGRDENLLVVPSLGQPCYDCFAAGDDPRTFYLWGAMGGAVPVALGLAIAQPEKRVLVITGDGELLMGLGSLTAAAAERQPNLAVCVLDNERYGETGQQQTVTGRGANLAAIAAGDPYHCQSVKTVRLLREATGPVFVVFKVSDAAEAPALPPKDGAYLKSRFRQAVVGRI